MKILNSYWPVNTYYVLVPFEGAEDLEEFLEHLHLILKLKIASFRTDGVAIEDENDQGVEAVSCHAGELGAEEGQFVRQKRLQQKYASLEEVIPLDDVLVQIVHEIERAEAAVL